MYRYLSHLRIYGLNLELLFSLKPHPHQHVPHHPNLSNTLNGVLCKDTTKKLLGKFYFGLY